MKNKVSYKQMLDNCEPDDLDQLHDILTMMAAELDRLNRKIDRINEVVPSSGIEAQNGL